MPSDARHALSEAIFEQVELYGKPQHRMLREDDRFSPWIGMHTGGNGDKKLDRFIAKLRKTQPKKMTRVRGARGAPADGTVREHSEGLRHDGRVGHGPFSVEFTAAGAGVISSDELHQRLRRSLALLERAMEGCFNEDGELKDAALFATLDQRFLSTVDKCMRLTERLNDAIENPALHKLLLAAAVNAVAPERRGEVEDQMNALIRDYSGMTATRPKP